MNYTRHTVELSSQSLHAYIMFNCKKFLFAVIFVLQLIMVNLQSKAPFE